MDYKNHMFFIVDLNHAPKKYHIILLFLQKLRFFSQNNAHKICQKINKQTNKQTKKSGKKMVGNSDFL